MKNLFFALAAFFVFMLSISHAGDIKGRVKAKGAKHSGDAIIYIDKIQGESFAAPKEHVQMNQKKLTFIPHVLPVLAGTTVDFLNSDDVLHNVFTPDECVGKVNLGTWPKGQTRSCTFKQPGCTAVMLCNVHPEMEAYLLVLETPYYAVSAKDGSYLIKDVPAGKHTLKLWHERLKGSEAKVEVPDTGALEVNFEIKK